MLCIEYILIGIHMSPQHGHQIKMAQNSNYFCIHLVGLDAFIRHLTLPLLRMALTCVVVQVALYMSVPKADMYKRTVRLSKPPSDKFEGLHLC